MSPRKTFDNPLNYIRSFDLSQTDYLLQMSLHDRFLTHILDAFEQQTPSQDILTAVRTFAQRNGEQGRRLLKDIYNDSNYALNAAQTEMLNEYAQTGDFIQTAPWEFIHDLGVLGGLELSLSPDDDPDNGPTSAA